MIRALRDEAPVDSAAVESLYLEFDEDDDEPHSGLSPDGTAIVGESDEDRERHRAAIKAQRQKDDIMMALGLDRPPKSDDPLDRTETEDEAAAGLETKKKALGLGVGLFSKKASALRKEGKVKKNGWRGRSSTTEDVTQPIGKTET